MTRWNRLGVASPLLVLAGLALACQDDIRVLGPENNPVLVNKTDTLSFQATGLDNVHGIFTWNWTNTGSTAVIDHRSLVPHGVTQLTIIDAAGDTVYTDNIQLVYQEVHHSSTGTPGTWVVELGMYGTTGDVDFSVIGAP